MDIALRMRPSWVCCLRKGSESGSHVVSCRPWQANRVKHSTHCAAMLGYEVRGRVLSYQEGFEEEERRDEGDGGGGEEEDNPPSKAHENRAGQKVWPREDQQPGRIPR